MLVNYGVRVFAVFSLLATCVATVHAQTPPFDLDDTSRIEAGRARFGANCAAYCHGFEGSGGKTAAFRGRKDLNADEVFKVITDGRKGADVMPAWGNGFSEEKRWELVAYIMYLGKSGEAPKPSLITATTEPPFDLMDPARIESGKGRFGANCAAYCHGFEGSGGKTPAFRGRADLKADEVFKIITEGRKGADVMPSWEKGFSAEKRWELVAYIMHLSRQPPTTK